MSIFKKKKKKKKKKKFFFFFFFFFFFVFFFFLFKYIYFIIFFFFVFFDRCYMNRIETSGSKMSLIFLVSFIYIVIAISTFCYLKVIKKIHDVESNLATMSCDGWKIKSPSIMTTNSQSASQRRTSSRIARATRKISVYILLQLIQYVPMIIYCLFFLFDIHQVWINILFIVLINL